MNRVLRLVAIVLTGSVLQAAGAGAWTKSLRGGETIFPTQRSPPETKIGSSICRWSDNEVDHVGFHYQADLR
jgi:hypothetical protein